VLEAQVRKKIWKKNNENRTSLKYIPDFGALTGGTEMEAINSSNEMPIIKVPDIDQKLQTLASIQKKQNEEMVTLQTQLDKILTELSSMNTRDQNVLSSLEK